MLFTVHRKVDANAFSVNIRLSGGEMSKCAVLACATRDVANALALSIDDATEPIILDSLDFIPALFKITPHKGAQQFLKLYIDKWDSYDLLDKVKSTGMDLVVINRFLESRLYTASHNPNDYINYLNDTLEASI